MCNLGSSRAILISRLTVAPTKQQPVTQIQAPARFQRRRDSFMPGTTQPPSLFNQSLKILQTLTQKQQTSPKITSIEAIKLKTVSIQSPLIQSVKKIQKGLRVARMLQSPELKRSGSMSRSVIAQDDEGEDEGSIVDGKPSEYANSFRGQSSSSSSTSDEDGSSMQQSQLVKPENLLQSPKKEPRRRLKILSQRGSPKHNRRRKSMFCPTERASLLAENLKKIDSFSNWKRPVRKLKYKSMVDYHAPTSVKEQIRLSKKFTPGISKTQGSKKVNLEQGSPKESLGSLERGVKAALAMKVLNAMALTQRKPKIWMNTKIGYLKDKNGDTCGPLRLYIQNREVPTLPVTRCIGCFSGVDSGLTGSPDLKEFDLDEERDICLFVGSYELFETMSVKAAVDGLTRDLRSGDLKEANGNLLRSFEYESAKLKRDNKMRHPSFNSLLVKFN